MAGPIRTPSLDSKTVRRIAALADVDPRTAVRVLTGGRSLARERVLAAAAELGIDVSPVTPPEPSAAR